MPEVVIEAKDLKKYFPVTRGLLAYLFPKRQVHVKAVDGVSFSVDRGTTLALAGESGCGKTTTGLMLAGLLKPTSGAVLYRGRDVFRADKKSVKEFRKRVQIIFQDPYASLNPSMTVFDIVAEPLLIHKVCKSELGQSVEEALRMAELEPPEKFTDRYPHELSGGQRQRVAIARAIVLRPEFIVADEPVSMLDVSIRAQILNLLKDLQRELNLSLVYISHDLGSVRYISHHVAIMYLGKIVEYAENDELFSSPLHPYTEALLAAVPVPDPEVRKAPPPLKGEVPSAVAIPPGCRFHPRCPKAMPVCERVEPPLRDVGGGHLVACHLYSKPA